MVVDCRTMHTGARDEGPRYGRVMRCSFRLFVSSILLALTACGADDAVGQGDPDGATGPASSGGGGGGSSGAAGTSSGGPGGSSGDAPSQPAPAIAPELLLVTYVGGAGDQYLRSVRFEADGALVAEGTGFSVRYPSVAGAGAVTGNAATDDSEEYSEKPALYKQFNNEWTVDKGAKRLDDPRNGLTYYFGTQQVSNDAQQPLFLACATGQPCSKDAFTFRLWGWWASLVKDSSLNLQADSRGYDTWLMPGGRVGIQAWTDGGNSTLGRDPRRTQECSDAATCTDIRRTLDELGVSRGTWQAMPDAMATMYMSFDPTARTPLHATFLRGSHVTRFTQDPWGRLFIPQAVGKAFPTVDPDNPFGHSDQARSGLFVLDEAMRSLANLRLGGTCEAQQVLPELVLRDGILAMAGTTCATDLRVTDNAVQKSAGGAQDGFLVVLKLW